MRKTLAALDVGTNSILLLIAEVEGGRVVRVLEERGDVPRIGRDLDRTGCLHPEGSRRALQVLAAYGAIAKHHGARIAAVGTQALREASDAPEFLRRAREALGAEVEVVSGEREAALTFRAVARAFDDLAAPLAVVDIGGGSTEIIRGESRRGRPDSAVSMPIGSVRVTERHLRAETPTGIDVATARAEVEAMLRGIGNGDGHGHGDGDGDAAGAGVGARTGAGVGAGAGAGAGAGIGTGAGGDVTLVGVAASVTTVAAVMLALTPYDGARVHGQRVPRAEVERQIELYRTAGAARASIPGVDPRRADVILGGAIVLAAVMDRFAAREVVVSDRGVRWGLLWEMIEG